MPFEPPQAQPGPGPDSYRPYATSGAPGTPVAYGAPPAAVAPSGSARPKRRIGLLIAGLVLVAAGVIAGLMILGSSSTGTAVKKFARAPIGCSTTMTAERTATFNIYVEHAGRLPEYGGDCPAAGTYSSNDEVGTPEVVITNGGDEVELSEASGERYDADGFKGRRVFTAKLEKGEEYRVTVTSDDAAAAEQMAVAVGIDDSSPSKLSSARTMGIVSLIGGPVLGLPLILLGLRRRQPPGSAGPPAAYQPAGPASATYQPPRYQPGYPGSAQPGPVQPGWGQPGWDRPSGDDGYQPPSPPDYR